MEEASAAMKTSELPSELQLVSHGSSQRSPTRNARPVFVPKQPPRPRQRGALPRTFSEPDEQACSTQHAGAAMQPWPSSASHVNASAKPFAQETAPSSSQQEASYKVMEEQAFVQGHMALTGAGWQGHVSLQHGMVPPRQRGSSTKRKNAEPLLQRGDFPDVGKSRSWHRVSAQESPHQTVIIRPAQEKNHKSRQRGAIHLPFQEVAMQAPFGHSPSSQGLLLPPSSAPMDPRDFPTFPQMKSSFSEMWLQLEGAIQGRERMLLGAKADMEKCLFQVKISKDDALRERNEAEASKAGAIETAEATKNQTSAREDLERISTDLSVQVAELNHLVQQVQEQQRFLNVLDSLKDYHDTSNDKDSFMNKNLQECEVKVGTMERELAASKQALELLEEAALKKIHDLQEIEAGCGIPISLADNACSDKSVVKSKLNVSTGATENFSKTWMDLSPSGLNGEQQTWAHSAGLKQPKLEAVI